MAEISRFASGAPWEPLFGYSRAVKAGGWVAVSGTTSIDAGGVVGKNQMYVQARQAIANLAAALERAGAGAADVVRTRVFVTDIARFDEVARAHHEYFDAHRPASTLIEVRRLVHPDMLVEIEADAYVGGPEAVQNAPAATRVRKAPSRAMGKTKARRGRTSPKASRKRR